RRTPSAAGSGSTARRCSRPTRALTSHSWSASPAAREDERATSSGRGAAPASGRYIHAQRPIAPTMGADESVSRRSVSAAASNSPSIDPTGGPPLAKTNYQYQKRQKEWEKKKKQEEKRKRKLEKTEADAAAE